MMISRKQVNGIEGYSVPSNELLQKPVLSSKWVNGKKKSFIDFERKNKEFLPPPGKYINPSDWAVELTNRSSGGSPLKGKFLKSNRATIPTDIQAYYKKDVRPDPGFYHKESS